MNSLQIALVISGLIRVSMWAICLVLVIRYKLILMSLGLTLVCFTSIVFTFSNPGVISADHLIVLIAQHVATPAAALITAGLYYLDTKQLRSEGWRL